MKNRDNFNSKIEGNDIENLDLITVLTLEIDGHIGANGKKKMIKVKNDIKEDYDVVFWYFDDNSDDYIFLNPQLPKFENKEIIKEYSKEHKILGIYFGWLRGSMLFHYYADYLNSMKSKEEFEKLALDWDTKRKLRSVVGGNNKTKRKGRIM